MATRNIHKKQPLAQRSKTLRQLGGISALHTKPRWEKYLKIGKIAEEIGKEDAALIWRKRAYSSALDHGEYANAEAFAAVYLGKRAAAVANALAILNKNVSSGRTNRDLDVFVANAISVGAPRELIAWELSDTKNTNPDITLHDLKNNPMVYSKVS